MSSVRHRHVEKSDGVSGVPSSKKEVTDLRGWEMGRERSKETSDVWLLVWVWVQSAVCVCVCVCVGAQ